MVSKHPASTEQTRWVRSMRTSTTLVYEQFPSLARNFSARPPPNRVHRSMAMTRRHSTSQKKGTGGGQLAQTDPLTREFEREMAKTDSGESVHRCNGPLLVRMAGPDWNEALHMFTTATRHETLVRVLRRPETTSSPISIDHVRDLHQPALRLEPRRHSA